MSYQTSYFKTHLHFSIFTATLVTRLGLSLSTPMASPITTWPKQPSPRGFPSTSLLRAHNKPKWLQVDILQRRESCDVLKGQLGYLSLDTSQQGSWGSSYSETPDSIGVPLEESREGLTNITPEFREELDSTDTCRIRKQQECFLRVLERQLSIIRQTSYLLSVTCLRRGMLLASLWTASWPLKLLFLDELRTLTMVAIATMMKMRKNPMQ